MIMRGGDEEEKRRGERRKEEKRTRGCLKESEKLYCPSQRKRSFSLTEIDLN